MAIPQYQEILGPFLGVLSKYSQLHLDDLAQYLGKHFKLTEEEFRQRLESGNDNVFRNRIRWARLFLVRAGCIDSPRRSVYGITERGRKMYAAYGDGTSLEHLKRFGEFKEWLDESNGKGETTNASNKPVVPLTPTEAIQEPDEFSGSFDLSDFPPESQQTQLYPDETTTVTPGKQKKGPRVAAKDMRPEPFDLIAGTPEELMGRHYKQHNAALVSEILDMVCGMHPDRFEYLIKQLMHKMGFGVDIKLGKSKGGRGDGGIDGEVWADKLGLDKIFIQAKRYSSNPIPPDTLRAFRGAISSHGGKKGIFVTASRFTDAAISEEKMIRASDIKIVLIDGQELARLMIEYGLGVSVKTTYQLKAIDQDFFES